MRWKPVSLSKREQNLCAIVTSPFWLPVAVTLAIWMSPAIFLYWLSVKWITRQMARGRHQWFAWRPVKFDAVWHDDIESCWFGWSALIVAVAIMAGNIGRSAFTTHTRNPAMTSPIETPLGCWRVGTRLRKRKGSSWQGRVVGFYSTDLTPVGYAVESEREPGSVQIYPESALEEWDGAPASRAAILAIDPSSVEDSDE